ncbi:mxaC protein [Methylomagnum ishizawai]|uniref:MxaC protein n=1 Tax=Methylomagnum ishizawai TaxID=1760988 RepID=A0A1Y6D127_9GAMM|nr:vWA domain-containing protein [Methylomagnum ishizawai]SMF96629.1 mxaC protein [Methylomagnum ishizawai]
MSLGFTQPLWLWLVPLATLPLCSSLFVPVGYPWNALLPGDTGSRALDYGLRLLGVLAFVGLILGLAGPYLRESSVERVGQGANLVLLLDRSRSMDDSFAGRTPGGGEEAKSAAAVRLLDQFIDSRPHDRIGVAAFSTGPLFVLPFTDNREAVAAAVRAAGLPGLAQTHVAKGLALALSYFEGGGSPGSRAVLLVSDGAAVIDRQSEALLRRAFVERGVRLYWIFLRTAGNPGLFELPEAVDDTPEARPERHLHLFFESLGIPYRAYEAENPEALGRAMADIDRLENLPLRYTETHPRQPLDVYAYALAVVALAGLAVAKCSEVEPCPAR